MADLSPTMLNQVLEVTLALMILVLAMSVTAIVRVRPATSGTTETGANGEPAAPAYDPLSVAAGPAPWAAPHPNGHLTATASGNKTGLFGRGRYEARHVRGRLPKQRTPGPAGPPWGPAAPPGRPPQGSERWT